LFYPGYSFYYPSAGIEKDCSVLLTLTPPNISSKLGTA